MISQDNLGMSLLYLSVLTIIRFDIGMLATRVVDSVEWLSAQQETRTLNIGLFGASTGIVARIVMFMIMCFFL